MARLLVHPRPLPYTPLQTQAVLGPSCLLLRQTAVLPGGGRTTLSMPPHGYRTPLPHTHVWSGPPNPTLHCAQGHEQLLAQSPDIDDKQLLLHTHLHPRLRGLPPPDCLLLQILETTGRPQGGLCPPIREPGLGQTSAVLPLSLHLQGSGFVQAPYERTHLCLPPPELANRDSLPPHEETPTG